MNVYYKVILVILISYLIGNISPAVILGKLANKDIRKFGSGNAGTTNVFRILGAKAALITLIIDILKGVVALKAGFLILGNLGEQIAFVFVVLGHILPVFLKFKGGKGVATAFGAAWILNWPSAFLALLIVIAGVLVTKKMSVGTLSAVILYPIFMLHYGPEYLPLGFVMAIIILIAHRGNIKRLFNGEENEISLKSRNMKSSKASEDIENGYSENEQAITLEKLRIAKNERPNLKISKKAVDYFKNEKKNKLTKDEKKKIGVIGTGSFGTAIANILSHNGHNVMMWGRNEKDIETLKKTRENRKHLKGVLLSESMKYTKYFKTAISGRDVVVFAVPAQNFRKVIERSVRYISEDTIIINLAKGIEKESLKLMSDIAKEYLPKNKYVALSGPSHAEEIVRNFPATVVVASEDQKAAKLAQDILTSNKFRTYTSDDIKGVEIGGALKNVIAIGTGISDGMGNGDNSKAAIMTRGIHEITRLGVKMGASAETFSGLSGIGDLMVTCSSDLSRNRKCGIYIGKGFDVDEAISKIGSTVEGVSTVEAAHKLAKKEKIDMPITDAIYKIIKGKIKKEEAMELLMNRAKKEEKN